MPNINKKKDRWFVHKTVRGKQQPKRKSRDSRYDSALWRKIRKQVLIRDKYLCQQCLREGMHTAVCQKKMDHAVDHIKPVKDGGKFFDMSNLETLCRAHHEQKSTRTSRG